MKAFIITLGSALLLLYIAFVSALTWTIPIHNANARTFQKNFSTVIHPKESRILTPIMDFANFGNSNHCDYVVGEFRVSSLSRTELVERYEEQTISPPDTQNGIWDGVPPRESSIGILFTDSETFQQWPWSEWLHSAQPLSSKQGGTAYLVYALESGYPPRGDYRCH